MKSFFLVSIFLIIASFYLPETAAVRPACVLSDTFEQIVKIKTRIAEIREQSKDNCEDRGNYSMLVEHDELEHHSICTSPIYPYQRVYVEAQIAPENLDQGTSVSGSAREFLKPHHRRCASDHAGHVIANELGGLGLEWNLFPQAANLNVGHWRTVSNPLVRHLREVHEQESRNFRMVKDGTPVENVPEIPNRYATIQIAFEFGDTDLYLRPTKFFFAFDLFTENKCEKTI